MPELSTTHLPSANGQQLKKVVFDTSPKMSTYLLAWAVGEFDFVQGVTKGGVMLRVFSPPGRGPQGKFALDVGIRSLDFYDEYFKVIFYPHANQLLLFQNVVNVLKHYSSVSSLLHRCLTLSPSWT